MSQYLNSVDFEKVAKTNLFNALSHDEVKRLLGRSVVLTEGKNALLFNQGDEADRFYILLEGRVKLFTTNEEGEESVVEIYSEVASFAEAAMFSSMRFPVNCETVLPSRLARVDRSSFLKALKENPSIANNILAKLAGRYRLLLNEIIQLKTQSPAQRLGALFLSLADGCEGSGVDLPYGKNLIAARIGMKPESLSRALIRLREIGVDCHKQHLVIKDIEKLRQFCEI